MAPRSSTSEGFSSDVLSVERRGAVALLRLDRAEARNALGPEFWRDLPSAVSALDDDPAVRAVVVAAEGRDFSVGLDLKAMFGAEGIGAPPDGPGRDGAGEKAGGRTGPPSMAARALAARRSILRMQSSVTSVADCTKPVLAAVHGWCIGGGVDVIAACDIRLASADARFSVRETRMAIVADLGSLQRLPGIIAKGQVAELAFTGKDIDAARAKEIGLVNEVHPDREATLEAAVAMAEEIAANSPLAVQGTKAVLRAGEGRSVEEGLDYVAVWNSAFLQSDDLLEALASFTERRPARFTGR